MVVILTVLGVITIVSMAVFGAIYVIFSYERSVNRGIDLAKRQLQKKLRTEQTQQKRYLDSLEDPKLGELGEVPKVPELEAPAPGGPFRGAK